MESVDATPLESALLKVFHGLYRTQGFPLPERVRVRARDNTGHGRYVDLDVDLVGSTLEDGYLDLAGRFIEMDGIPNGLMAVVRIKDGQPDQLEIAVYGDTPWDGQEHRWSITDAPVAE